MFSILDKTYFLILAGIFACVPLSAKAINISDEPVRPISGNVNLDQKKVELGNRLFHDPSLSSNGKISCSSCHDLNKGGTDNLNKSIGVSGNIGAINSPTVFNIGEHFAFFWDGRAKNLEEQIDGPVHNPDEMASNWEDITKILNQDKKYKEDFLKIYGSPPTEKNIKDAIVTFEKSLITPNSPFDRYLKGDENAISSLAKNGYFLFKTYGCSSCHQGKNFGGNMFQKLGIVDDYFEARNTPVTEADLGRYNVTKDKWDMYVFKVPSLRNIALTAPYMHDGTAKTLEDAIDVMARYQLGQELSREEMAAFVAFLESLTGEYKGEVLK